MDLRSFMTKKGVPHTITTGDGTSHTLTFYPIQVRKLAILREATKAIVSAVNVLLRKTDETVATQTSDAGFVQIKTAPVDADQVAKFRENENKAIGNLVEVLLHPQNIDVVGELILSSLRDVHEKPSPKEFMDSIEPDTLVQMLRGFFEANRKFFSDPLFRGLRDRMERVRKTLSPAANPAQEEGSDSSTSSEPKQPSEQDHPSLKILSTNG